MLTHDPKARDPRTKRPDQDIGLSKSRPRLAPHPSYTWSGSGLARKNQVQNTQNAHTWILGPEVALPRAQLACSRSQRELGTEERGFMGREWAKGEQEAAW
jgi:hypothetical protein